MLILYQFKLYSLTAMQRHDFMGCDTFAAKELDLKNKIAIC